MRTILILCACLWTAQAVAQARFDIHVVPAAPQAFDTVRVRLPGAMFDQTAARFVGVNMAADNTLVLDFLCGSPCISLLPPEMPARDVVVGQLPPGHYRVRVRLTSGEAVADNAPEVAHTEFTVAARAWPAGTRVPPYNVDFTDMWWDPSQPGWGLSIYQRPEGQLFAAFFTYDNGNRPTFYTMQGGRWTDCNMYEGTLYRSIGSSATGDYDANAARTEAVGTGRLRFISLADRACGDNGWFNGGRFRYTIDGVTVDRPIQRFFLQAW